MKSPAFHKDLHWIIEVTVLEPYLVRVRFDNGRERSIDLEPLLHGEPYGMLRDLREFAQARIDSGTGMLHWPCGAGFDPLLLYTWDDHMALMTSRLKEWAG